MKSVFLTALAFLIPVLPVQAQGNPPQPPPPPSIMISTAIDLSTPENTVRSFLNAFARRDVKAMGECVSGAVYSPAAQQYEKGMRNGMRQATGEEIPEAALRIALISPQAMIKDDTAVLTFHLQAGALLAKSVSTEENTLSLIREGKEWKIVTPTQEELAALPSRELAGQNFVRNMAILVRYPEVATSARDRARATASLSNVKQISLACLLYIQDHHEMFPADASAIKKLLMPYLKFATVFTSPVDPVGTQSYHLNPKIAGKAMSAISAPAQTVLLYEGEWKKPLFRYQGKAVIGYADGHCQLATPADLKKAIWQLLPPVKAKSRQ